MKLKLVCDTSERAMRSGKKYYFVRVRGKEKTSLHMTYEDAFVLCKNLYDLGFKVEGAVGAFGFEE